MLHVGLADFQAVHPTEMETVETKMNTGLFEPDETGLVRAVINTISTKRRKRIPISGGQVIIRKIRMVSRKDPQDLTFPVDPQTGRALCEVTMDQLPQLPMDCEFEFYGPSGLIERGSIRCGGNEPTQVKEVVLRVA